jgi:uncharacterized protein (TIRG00374 family)
MPYSRKHLNRVIRWSGIVLLGAILLGVKWKGYLAILREAHPVYLWAAVFFNFLKLFFESWRWKIFAEIQGIRYGMKNTLLASMSSIYLGLATPGELGNFAKVLYLSEDTRRSVGSSLANVIADKILDLLMLVAVGLWGLATIRTSLVSPVVAAGFAVFAAVLTLVAVGSKKCHAFVEKKFLKTFRLEKFAGGVEKNRQDFYAGLGRYSKNPAVLVPVLMTLASFACLFLQANCLVRAIGIDIPPWSLAQILAVSIMISRVIPLTFSGLGSKDVALVLLFREFGTTLEQGIAFSLLFLFTSSIVTAAVGVACWAVKPIRIPE